MGRFSATTLRRHCTAPSATYSNGSDECEEARREEALEET